MSSLKSLFLLDPRYQITPVAGKDIKVSLFHVSNTYSISYLKNKPLINISFSEVDVEIRRLQKSKEKLIDNLQVRPCQL